LGYATVASLLLILATLFVITRRHWDQSPETSVRDEPEDPDIPLREALRHGAVWVHILLFFIYTGLEVTVGQWSYSILTEARAVPKETAGLWVTVYWAGIGVGRLLLGFVVERIGIDRVLRFSMLIAVLGAALFMADISALMSSLALALIGLGLASIFPSLMTRTPQRLGKGIAAHAIGFQVSAAMLGAAALPSLAGFLGQRFGLEAISVAAVAMAVCLGLLHEGLLFSSRRQTVPG
ncbi:MAG TPA: MFS transporter, partial [Prosthecobacter sp.]|nr:MFS transporter [Prosthecobacter sp.]